MTDIPAFPLPMGHRYGLNPYDVAVHDGTESTTDQHYLRLYQREYAKYDRDMTVTGQFDGPTQRSAIAAQRACGLTITAEVDAPTWVAVFDGRLAPETGVEPRPPRTREPVDLGKMAGVVDTASMKTQRVIERTRESSANKIIWRNRHKGEAPEWFRWDEVDRINKVRSILGMAPGKNTVELRTRIKGIQRAGKLAPTGAIDTATAWLIDEITPVVAS